MKNKIFIISISVLAIAVCIYFFVLKGSSKSAPALFAISENAVIIVDIPELSLFNIEMQMPAMLELNVLQPVEKLNNGIQLLQHIAETDENLQQDLKTQHICAGGFFSENSAIDYVFVLALDEAKKLNIEKLGVQLNEEDPSITSHEYEKERVHEFNYRNSNLKFSAAKVFGLLIISSSTVLTENAILQLKNATSVTENSLFTNVYDKINKGSNAAYIVNIKQFSNYLASYTDAGNFEHILKFQHFATWIGFRLKVEPTEINLSGYASAADESILANISDEDLNADRINNETIFKIAPNNTASLIQLRTEQLQEYFSYRLGDTSEDLMFQQLISYNPGVFAYGFKEPFFGNHLEKSFIIVPVNNINKAIVSLRAFTARDTTMYKHYIINKLNDPDLLNAVTGFNGIKNYYYTSVDSSLLFCTSTDQLKNIIENYSNRQTLFYSDEYESMHNVEAKTNFQFYLDLSKCEQLISGILSDKKRDVVKKNFTLLDKFNPLLFQFTNTGDAFLFSGSIKYTSEIKNKTGLIWKAQLDAPASSEPVVVYNHLSKQKAIVVQDTLNQLYLISADGSVIWKKQLLSELKGTVFEVDYYGNNKTQLLFATNYGIQMLDMNGNSVEGFQIDFTSPAVSYLSLFKNSQYSDYIFFISCENGNIYGFSKEGKPLPGWNPMVNTGIVKTPVAFTITSNQDYLIFANNANKIFIKSGSGEDRRKTIQLNNPIIHTHITEKEINPVYFLNFDSEGNMMRIKLADGTFSSTPMENNFWDGTFCDVNNDSINDAVYIAEGKLFAKTIYGEIIYTAKTDDTGLQDGSYFIQTFSMDEKQYTGIYASSLKKIYAFDASGKILDGFPIIGATAFAVNDLTQSDKPVLITGNDNYLLAYRLK